MNDKTTQSVVAPRRNRFRGMMKEGRFRAFRNLPVGWVLQVLHSTDATERWIRIATEAVAVLMLWYLMLVLETSESPGKSIVVCFLFVHSLSWYFLGNFWVYMLDSFLWVKNPGIAGVLGYVDFVHRKFTRSESSNAILIYGSMCRGAFHGRSDLDLRIVRRPGILWGIMAVYTGFAVRIVAALCAIPVDLQVVDSLQFLNRQMRADEHPITVYVRAGFDIPSAGWSYEQVVVQPSLVMKDKSLTVTACS
jgi:predicted nucleotidyltransferase